MFNTNILETEKCLEDDFLVGTILEIQFNLQELK